MNKRQPNLVESLTATLDRFEILEQLEQIFIKPCKSMIVGGSLAYGSFYNTRENRDTLVGSDIDIIAIIESDADESAWVAFEISNIFNEDEKNEFLVRKKIYLSDLSPSNKADILSQKFRIAGKNFDVSMHFFTLESFEALFPQDINNETAKHDYVKNVRDYKYEAFTHKACKQVGFKGGVIDVEVPLQEKVDHGVITILPAYIIKEGEYYPGIYQNLILPTFGIYFDKDDITTDVVMKFKENVKSYADNQDGLISFESLLLRSHTRCELFPPALDEEISKY